MLIDVHHHCLPGFLLEAFGAAGRSPSLPRFPDWAPEMSISMMDQFGIDRAMLSMAVPGVHLGDNAAASQLAHRFNDYCAELGAQSDRFGAFGTLPLPDVDGALREIAHIYDDLGLDGVGLFASYGDVFLGDPMFEPVMAELDRRAAIVFVHPMGHPSSRGLKLISPIWMLEYPIDTTRAALNLILSGTLDRFKNIKFILAHGGGTLPYLAARLAGTASIDPRFPDLSAERIAAYLSSFFYETAQSSGAASFAALDEVALPDHVLFGSDFPYCGSVPIAMMVDNLPLLDGGTARLRASGTALLGSKISNPIPGDTQ